VGARSQPLLRHRLRHPAFLVVAGFAVVIFSGTFVLALPQSSADGTWTDLVTAFFTASSAVCVTGLAVVDTATAWSFTGKVAITVLVQVGGLGVMTVAALIIMSLHRRLGLVARRLTLTEAGAVDPGDLLVVLKGVLLFSLSVEVALAAWLAVRFATTYDLDVLTAVCHGVFHSVMSFNNAGFALYSDNMTPFATDWLVTVPVMGAVIIGGLGFPVLVEMLGRNGQERQAQLSPPSRRLSLHTRLTLIATVSLLVFGFVVTLAFEWSNPGTLGAQQPIDRLLTAAFHSTSTRTAGFNTVDVGEFNEPTLLVSNLLMFIGTGSASTGGGLKVTTFAVLMLVCLAEVRGDRSVTALGRSIPDSIQRQAVAVTLISIALVGGVTTFLLAYSHFPLDDALFETVSAFGTVGLSTGITGELGVLGQLALVPMMFFGRLGPLTLGYAFIARSRDRLYEFPEERPLVG
jgi:trk system potassium uptake protein